MSLGETLGNGFAVAVLKGCVQFIFKISNFIILWLGKQSQKYALLLEYHFVCNHIKEFVTFY